MYLEQRSKAKKEKLSNLSPEEKKARLREQRRNADRRHQEKIKNNPGLHEKYRERSKIALAKYRAKKKLEKQNNSLNNSANNSNHEVSTNFNESNQTYSTNLEFLMTNNIADNQDHLMTLEELDDFLKGINSDPSQITHNNLIYNNRTPMTEEEINDFLNEVNSYTSQVGNNDNTYITPQNISNNINLNNANNITKHPKPLILYDSDDDQNNFNELFLL